MSDGHGIACLPAPRTGFATAAPASGDSGGLAALRESIGAIEHASGFAGAVDGLVSIAPPVDAGLPWGGLPRGCLHEISGGEAASGFAAALAARLAGNAGGVLWCLRPRAVFDTGDLYGPGLVAFGLKPGQLIFAHAHSEADLLWAMEEGLRSGAPAVVLGEVPGIGLTASRRLQLAAEASGVTALLLHRPNTKRAKSSAAVTRWHVASASSNTGISLPPRCVGEGGVGGENALMGAPFGDRKNKAPPPFPPPSKGEGFLPAVVATSECTYANDPIEGGRTPVWSRRDASFSNASAITARWRVDLVRCRGAAPKSWLMDWRGDRVGVVDNEARDANKDSKTNDRKQSATQATDTGGFAVVAELFDRPAKPAPPLRRAS